MSVEVTEHELADDARLWWDAAGRLGACADAAEALSAPENAFSFLGALAVREYDSLRTQVWALLIGGVRAARDIAESLEQTRTTYLGTDESTRARLDGMAPGR